MLNIDRHNYEVYCKIVTENFIEMQTVTTCDDKEKMFIVQWEEGGGIEWSKDKTFETFKDGNLLDEVKSRNAYKALRYLQKNILTYEQWFEKYRKEKFEGDIIQTLLDMAEERGLKLVTETGYHPVYKQYGVQLKYELFNKEQFVEQYLIVASNKDKKLFDEGVKWWRDALNYLEIQIKETCN